MRTFLEVLTYEVGRMQAAHPERENELARAHALILHGLVVPSPTDPETGQVLSSDGHKVYHVNGSCDCQAGEHGRDCKHQHAWKLYQYIARKVGEQTAPDAPQGLGEAPASVNVRVTIAGREVQWTLRDTDEARLAERLEALLRRYPLQGPLQAPVSQGQEQPGWCPAHGLQMKWNDGKEGRQGWYSHRTPEGWCKGRS
jgi:hypothetical protein